jgi:hypothetical protein
MKAYDNPSCLTLDEFNKDLNQYIHIKKTIRKYSQDNTILRKLVNQIVVYYNCFGQAGTDLLLYKIKETDILQILVPIILYLGRSNSTIETVNISLNIQVIKQLNDL